MPYRVAFYLGGIWVLIFLDYGALGEGTCGNIARFLVSGTKQALGSPITGRTDKLMI